MNSQSYLEFAKKLALRAGDIMLEHFQMGIATDLKEDSTPVTVADTAINSLVIKEISEAYPSHGVIGEEESSLIENAEYVWVCDPIDGTLPYSLGIPVNVFSLALVHKGEPIVAVVYDPHMKRLYSAEKDKGAFLNDEPINVNKTAQLKNAIVGSFGYPSDIILDVAAMQQTLQANSFRMLILLCIIYEGVLVASGQIAAMVFPFTTVHDIATTKLIVEESGGLVTDIEGNQQRYDRPVNGAIVSNGLLHKELVKLLAPHLSDKRT